MQTIAKVVGIILLLMLMVGFGLCGALGLVIGFSAGFNSQGTAGIIMLGLGGFAVAIGMGFLIRIVWKIKTSPAPSPDSEPAP